MTDVRLKEDGEVPIFALGTALLRHWRKIALWAIVGFLFAVITASLKPPMYAATASFVPQGADVPRTGLGSLAGQFGVSLPSSNLSQSPEFYADLLKSRELLLPIVRGSIVTDQGAKPVPFLDFMGITGGSQREKEEAGIKGVAGMISPSVSPSTAVVTVRVTTKSPSASLAIVKGLIDGVNDFNLRTRQSMAAAERKFAEGRAAIVNSDLRSAEDRLEEFLQGNKSLNSPQLQLQRDRLQRAIDLEQQLLTSLTQSVEEARIREVRDTPVITVIDTPSLPTAAERRGRVRLGLLGILFGSLIGILLAFASETMRARRLASDPAAEEFFATWAVVKQEILGGWRSWSKSPPR